MVAYILLSLAVFLKALWNMWVPLHFYWRLRKNKAPATGAVDMLLFVEWFLLLALLALAWFSGEKRLFIAPALGAVWVLASYLVLYLCSGPIQRLTRRMGLK